MIIYKLLQNQTINTYRAMIDFDFYVKGIRAIYHYRIPKGLHKKAFIPCNFWNFDSSSIGMNVYVYYTDGGGSIVGIYRHQNAV